MALRVVALVVWQLLLLAVAFLVWANLFSEYGKYTEPLATSVGGVVLLSIALLLGTWLPIRRWRRGNEFSARGRG